MSSFRLLPLLTVSVAFAAAPAFAADGRFCEGYAHDAILQLHDGMSHPKCVAGIQGERWSAQWRAHYDWCLGVSRQAAVEAERERAAYLQGCIGTH